jgi:hypothetical protein
MAALEIPVSAGAAVQSAPFAGLVADAGDSNDLWVWLTGYTERNPG